MSINTLRRRQAAAAPSTFAESLLHWLVKHQGSGLTRVQVFRTSARSKQDFEAAFLSGIAMTPHDEDVKVLAALGHKLVMPEGKADRDRLGAMELRRGSVPGGSGKALLGWLIPIGRTLFILYLETARKQDIAGATVDQSRNAFTEALCAVVRSLKPQELYTPMMSRLVRNLDFGMQVLRTLREHQVQTWTGNELLVWTTKDSQLVNMMKAWLAADEATSTVDRLAGIEAGIYASGQWYLTHQLLPFVWRPRRVQRLNPLTGETETVLPDTRDLEMTPGSVEVFDAFVQDLRDEALTLPQVGTRLGERGVRDRAPKNFAEPVLLSELAQPGHAVTSLIQDRWLLAYKTGEYRTLIKLKSTDVAKARPGLRDSIVERDDEQFLEVTVSLPTPDGRPLLSDDDYDAILATRKADTPQRLGRAASSGDRRPLSSLCQYDNKTANKQYRLGTFDSSDTYTLLWRALSDAYGDGGVHLGWTKQDKWNKLAAVSAPILHASLSSELLRVAAELDGQLAPLQPPAVTRPDRSQLLATAVATAKEDLQLVKARVAGIRKLYQEAVGEEDSNEVALLKIDKTEAEADHLQAQKALAKAERNVLNNTAIEATSEPPAQQADLGSLEVLGVALGRCGAQAPAELNEALTHLLGNSLRVSATADGLAVNWNAAARVKLRAGGYATVSIGAVHVPGIAWTKRAPDGNRGPDWQKLLARQYFHEGMDFADLGRLRDLDGSGKGDTYLAKTLRQWLSQHGVSAQGKRLAAVDAPPAVRRSLGPLLEGQPPTTSYQEWLLSRFHAADDWTMTWAAEDCTPGRAVLRAVESLGGQNVPTTEVARIADLTWTEMLAVTGPRLVRRGGPSLPAVVARNFTRTAPRGGGLLTVLRCTHTDCLGLAEYGAPGVILTQGVPELAPSYQICRDCRRQPDGTAVHPELYLQPWCGGRRSSIMVDGTIRWIGTRLAQA
jgi:hypothetical protein